MRRYVRGEWAAVTRNVFPAHGIILRGKERQMATNWRAPRTWAHFGLAIQFLALIRCLLEYFRLKYVDGPAFDRVAAELFVQGAMLAAILCALGVLAYTLNKPRIVAGLAVATVIALLILKITWLP